MPVDRVRGLDELIRVWTLWITRTESTSKKGLVAPGRYGGLRIAPSESTATSRWSPIAADH
jgi:hypothetical protein